MTLSALDTSLDPDDEHYLERCSTFVKCVHISSRITVRISWPVTINSEITGEATRITCRIVPSRRVQQVFLAEEYTIDNDASLDGVDPCVLAIPAQWR
jgi:hypothetical protein